MNKMYLKILILVSAIFLSSCAGVTCEKVDIPIPPPLNYFKIQPENLEVLSDETYGKIVDNHKLNKARIETLESIIKSTK
jgi:hypothetical protein